MLSQLDMSGSCWLLVTLLAVCNLSVSILGQSLDGGGQCPGFCFCDSRSFLVSCTGDGNSVLPDSQVFGEWVYRLDIRNLMVRQLEEKHIQHLSQLRELSLVRCHLTNITNGIFNESSRLERLDLSQNSLQYLNRSMFTGLVRLKSLDISSNKLTQIDGAFYELVALEQLNLRDNMLVVLSPNSFQGLYRLQFLNVDSNNVSLVVESAFQELPSIAHLILSHNPLTELKHLDLFAARLTYVDLSWSNLQRVPNLMARYVRDLRLPGNNLRQLQRGDLESFTQVRLLVLDDNNISDIEDDTFGRMEKLEKLFLNDNLLTKIPSSLPAASLAALYLEGNRITTIKVGDFIGLTHLQQLHLRRNFIDNVEMGAFDQLKSLSLLDLSNNKLSRISPEMFYGLSRLEFLDISGNPVTHIEPMAFLHLSSLKILRTDSNETMDGLKKTNESLLRSTEQPILTTYDSRSTLESTITPTTVMEKTTDNQAAYRNLETILIISNTSSNNSMATISLEPRNRNTNWKNDESNGWRNRTGKYSVKDKSNRTEIKTSLEAANDSSQRPVSWSSILLWWIAIFTLLLSGLFATLSLIYCLNKSRFVKTYQNLSIWKRRTVPNKREKETIKLGWAIHDLDQWTTSSFMPQQDTEHERLILAVTPRH